MTSSGDGEITRRVLIIDLTNFEDRKEEISQQLHYAASEVGFVSFVVPRYRDLSKPSFPLENVVTTVVSSDH